MSNLSREITSTSDICHGAARGWTLLLGTVMVIESKINKRLLGTSSDHPEVAEILRKSVPLKQLHKDMAELMGMILLVYYRPRTENLLKIQ